MSQYQERRSGAPDGPACIDRRCDARPFEDRAAVPNVLDGTAFADEFRYWTGESGRRYLTRQIPVAEIDDFAGAPAVLLKVRADGTREIAWIGAIGADGLRTALAASTAGDRCEIHVHLLADDARRRAHVIRDLIDGNGPARQRLPEAA